MSRTEEGINLRSRFVPSPQNKKTMIRMTIDGKHEETPQTSPQSPPKSPPQLSPMGVDLKETSEKIPNYRKDKCS